MLRKLRDCPDGLSLFLNEDQFQQWAPFLVNCVDITRPMCRYTNAQGETRVRKVLEAPKLWHKHLLWLYCANHVLRSFQEASSQNLSLWIVANSDANHAVLDAENVVAAARHFEQNERLRMRKANSDRVMQRFENFVVCI